MKKTISNILLGSILLCLAACGSKDKEKTAAVKPEQAIAAAKEVISIGKILPEAGIINLSSTITGTVEKLYVKAGDSVKKGDLILQLRAEEQSLAASESQAQVATQVAKNRAAQYDVNMAEVKLKELQKKYETSKALAEKGAETMEVLNNDYSNFLQQQQILAQARQTVKANQQSLKELTQRERLSALNLADRQLKATVGGVMLRLDVKQGQVLQANETFGDLAPAGKLVVECEVDELYAAKVHEGLKVQIYPTSSATAVAEGYISTLGIALENKSILYEKIGEGADRRVRRMTVTITKAERPLLINDKVEVKIQLD